MPALTIKNIPADLYERLKQSASRNRRSINQETITLLDQRLPRRRPTAEETAAILERARVLRESIGHFFTEEEITAAKREGRL